MEAQKEFNWNNVMYDVVHIQKLDSAYLVFAYEDQIETEIIRFCKKASNVCLVKEKIKRTRASCSAHGLNRYFFPQTPNASTSG